MINENEIKNLIGILKPNGVIIHKKDIIVWNWPKGISTHIPKPLPSDMMAIYGFKYGDFYLKIGATRASDRFYQQHYCPNGANSCLARSILLSKDLGSMVGNQNIREWIRENTDRWNILIPQSYGDKVRDFIETYFILKFKPRFNW